MRFFRRAASLLAASVLVVSCAYRLGNISGKEVQGVKSVYVPMAKNESYYPDLQANVTNAISRRFNTDGTLETENSAKADSELDVVITDVRRNPIRGTKTDVIATAEYQLIVEAKITFINRRLGRTVVAGEAITGQTQFFIQQDAVEGERQALPLAAEDLANNVVKRITEGW
jgi:Lipopolysaccharide-assembly